MSSGVGVVIVRHRKPDRLVCGHLTGEAGPRERAFCKHCQVWLRAAFDGSGWIADYYWRQAGPLRSAWYDVCTSLGIFGYGRQKDGS